MLIMLNYLTRGELTGLIAKLLGLTDSHVTPENLYPTFIDVDKDHPAYMHIELVNSLGILPSYIINRFEPSRLVITCRGGSFVRFCYATKFY